MSRLVDILPAFAEQVAKCLRSEGNPELADQIAGVQVERWTYEASHDAGFIYLEPSPAANITKGPRYSVDLDDIEGWVLVDVDNLGRVTSIEVMNRAAIFDELAKRMPASL